MRNQNRYKLIVAVALLMIAVPISLWAYERYQTQKLLNEDVEHAADNYADAMRNLNKELERFERQN